MKDVTKYWFALPDYQSLGNSVEGIVWKKRLVMRKSG